MREPGRPPSGGVSTAPIVTKGTPANIYLSLAWAFASFCISVVIVLSTNAEHDPMNELCRVLSPEDFIAPDAPDDVASSIEALAAINTRLDAAYLAYAQMESRVTALTLALETARNSLPSLNETRAQLLLDQHALTTAITRDITTLNTLPSAMDTLARERRNLVQQLRSAKFTYQAIADLLGVTESRVKQIEKAAEREHNRAINLAAMAAKRAGTPH